MAVNINSTTKPTINVPVSLNFLFGGLSGCLSICVVQPLDMIKTQIQLASEGGSKTLSSFYVTKTFLRENSFKALYRGLDSALLRQVLYSTTRLGIFYSLNDALKKKNKGIPSSMIQKIGAAITAGGIGAAIANPADLVLIRMQADSRSPPEKRRNYKNAFDGLSRIFKEEGIATLWRGSFPTIMRAIIINVTVMVSFEEFKERLINFIPDTFKRTIVSSLLASFICSLSCLPFDNTKTKIQNMRRLPDGSHPYKGMLDCFFKTVKNEGPFRLWVGFPTFYLRGCPYAIINLLLNDYFRLAYIASKS